MAQEKQFHKFLDADNKSRTTGAWFRDKKTVLN